MGDVDWKRMVEEQEKSGQSGADFCKKRGISEGSFWYWRRKLVSERRADKFVRVDEGERVAVELPGGKTIRIRREELRYVLEALCVG